MSERVYCGALELAALQALVEAFRPQARFAIVERIDAIDFPPPQTAPIDAEQWFKGRLFDESFELRWEQVEAVYRVILSGTDDLAAEVSGLHDWSLPPGTDELQEYYCWNEQDARLGRTLDYRCVPGHGNVKLLVREFRDEHGRLVFWRYVKMERDGGGQ